jgi:hypothetical protein
MSEQITIKSNTIQQLAKDGPILLNTNKEIHMSATKQITFDVGPIGTKDPQFVYRVNSPRIELGIPPNAAPNSQLEAIPKADQLINILTQMLSIMNDMATNPSEVNTLTGEIAILQQQLYKIKSTISYTV